MRTRLPAPGSTGESHGGQAWMFALHLLTAAKDIMLGGICGDPSTDQGAETPVGMELGFTHLQETPRDAGDCQTSGGFWLQGSGTCSNDPPANQGDAIQCMVLELH